MISLWKTKSPQSANVSNNMKSGYVTYPCSEVDPASFTGPFDWDTYRTDLTRPQSYLTYGYEMNGCNGDPTGHPHLPMIVCDLKLEPGGSGGPLFRKTGELIGIACLGSSSFNSFVHVSAIKELLRRFDQSGNYIGPAVEPNLESDGKDDDEDDDDDDDDEESSDGDDAQGALDGNSDEEEASDADDQGALDRNSDEEEASDADDQGALDGNTDDDMKDEEEVYVKLHGVPFDANKFASCLWGDFYFDTDARLFKKKQPVSGVERSSLQFVLEPLYKIFSQVIRKHQKGVDATLTELGVTLSHAAFKLNVRPLLRLACSSVFGSGTEFTDCSTFATFGRVYSGELKTGQSVHVLGEGYSPEDEEGMPEKEVTKLWVYQARYRIPISKAPPDSSILIERVDRSIMKTATLYNVRYSAELYSFWPLQFNTLPVAKTATEPLNPNELPKMFEGLRNISKSYTLTTFKVEESGEQMILGTGQLYLDSIMKDLRELYLEVEVKVADRVVSFCESFMDSSSSKCYAETPNTKNKITMIAESLEKGLAVDMEKGVDWPHKNLSDFVQTKYDWDLLAARGIWAFGPDKLGLNILLDNMLSSELDKPLLNAVKDSVAQGFQWGAREGPLCDKPIRNVKFKIVDAKNAPEPSHRVGGQIIPTPRRVAYSAFLMATPSLMEPVYYIEIETSIYCISAIYLVLSRRCSHVTADIPQQGTPAYLVKAFLPMIESFGFESDLRYHTQGQAFCLSVFDHWAIVPADPLDTSIVLRPLMMNKVVSINRFFDEALVVELAQKAADFHLQTV